jgi:hypothetical protein
MTTLRNRLLIHALVLGLAAPTAFVGCGEVTETKSTVEQKSKEGTTTEEKIDKVRQTGENPPPPTGDTAAPK